VSDTESAPPPPGGPPPAAPPAAAPPKRRAPRWMKIVLVLSLVVNLLVLGYGVARFLHGPRFVSAGPAASFADARKLYWSLPHERREALREEFVDRYQDEFFRRQREWRDARDRLAATLARPDASADDIREAYAALGKMEADASVRWRQVLADMTLALDPEERERYAERFNWRGPGRHFDDEGRHRDDRPPPPPRAGPPPPPGGGPAPQEP